MSYSEEIRVALKAVVDVRGKKGQLQRKHCHSLARSLSFVGRSGKRQCFVWENLPVISVFEVDTILDKLRDEGVFPPDVQQFRVADEICIGKKSEILNSLENESYAFVDISKNLPRPQIVCGIGIVEALKDTLKTGEINLTFPKSICLTSVLGLLANYPVIYTFDSINEIDQTCLSGHIVKVFKVCDSVGVNLFSFSIPKIILEESLTVQELICKWNAKQSQLGLFVSEKERLLEEVLL